MRRHDFEAVTERERPHPAQSRQDNRQVNWGLSERVSLKMGDGIQLNCAEDAIFVAARGNRGFWAVLNAADSFGCDGTIYFQSHESHEQALDSARSTCVRY